MNAVDKLCANIGVTLPRKPSPNEILSFFLENEGRLFLELGDGRRVQVLPQEVERVVKTFQDNGALPLMISPGVTYVRRCVGNGIAYLEVGR